MTTYVALLRAINVGGRNAVPMAQLRELLAELGYGEARTLLQSGNAVFRAPARAAQALPKLERDLEARTAARFGHKIDYCVRSAAEWDELIAENPFPAEAARQPARVVAMILKDAPPPESVEALQASLTGPELVRARDRVLYAHYPIDIGNSKLTGSLIERKLGTRGTARNWNTVLKLAALAAAVTRERPIP